MPDEAVVFKRLQSVVYSLAVKSTLQALEFACCIAFIGKLMLLAHSELQFHADNGRC